jgi:hypothetical protein
MLERTDAITNEVLEPITFVLAYPTVMEQATSFKIKPVELSVTYMKRLCAHPRDLTRASQLTSCKRGFNDLLNQKRTQQAVSFVSNKFQPACSHKLIRAFELTHLLEDLPIATLLSMGRVIRIRSHYIVSEGLPKNLQQVRHCITPRLRCTPLSYIEIPNTKWFVKHEGLKGRA